MSVIAAARGVLPEHRYAQDEITDMVAGLIGGDRREALLRRVHSSARVDTRHLVLPLERYAQLADFGAANDEWLRHAEDLGARAIDEALAAAGMSASDVDLVVSTTVTGVAAPSLEARLAKRVGLRPDVKRLPLFGLGCVAGAAGVARLHDFLAGNPDGVAVLLSVELCSLTMQAQDDSTANLVATGLFGDGAAAVVAVGERRAARDGVAGPHVVDSRSHLFPDTERTMGWDVTPGGLRIVLDAAVPELVHRYVGEDVRGFLHDHGLAVDDVAAWICHPGGPKVIEAIVEELELPAEALDVTWRSLAAVGNLSSSSVLHVLADTLRAPDPPPGSSGVLMALGPGFCAEFVLLRWS